MNKQARWVTGVRTQVGDMAGREARLRVGNMIGSSREKGKKKGGKGRDPSENKNKNEGEERRQVTYRMGRKQGKGIWDKDRTHKSKREKKR